MKYNRKLHELTVDNNKQTTRISLATHLINAVDDFYGIDICHLKKGTQPHYVRRVRAFCYFRMVKWGFIHQHAADILGFDRRDADRAVYKLKHFHEKEFKQFNKLFK